MAGMFGKLPVNSLAALSQQSQQPRGSYPNALAGMVQNHHAPARQAQPDYGQRVDGTKKGRGFLGELKTPDGRVMTEYSVGVDWGEGEQEIPTIIPTLTPEERDYLVRGGKPNDAIIEKAIEHARKRVAMGLSPFAMQGIDY